MSLKVIGTPEHASPNRARRRRGAVQASTGLVGSLVLVLSLIVLLATLVAAVGAGAITHFDPTRAVPVDRLLGPGSRGHLMGTDQIGRDVFARLVYGARLAWVVGIAVSLGSVLAGGVAGVIAGYLGGLVDLAITRVVDAILAFPALLLALVFAAIMQPSTTTAVVALVIAFTPLTTRMMRAGVLAEKELDYVAASRGLGNSELWTLVRHIVPNTLGPLLVIATLVVSRAIIVEASLSFLGAGTQPPAPNWGVMISEAREVVLTQPDLVIIPAAVLSATVLAMNLVADWLGDVIDPTNQARKAQGR